MSEWGNPLWRIAAVLQSEYIGLTEQTRGSETSQYPEEKKTTSDSPSSGERTGKSLNRNHASAFGVAGPRKDLELLAEAFGKRTKERDSRVRENGSRLSGVPK